MRFLCFIARPIFLKAYEVLYVNQTIHTQLADVHVPPTGVSRPSNPPNGVANVTVTKALIYNDVQTLEKLVKLLVDIEPPFGDRTRKPPIVNQFFLMCNFAFPDQSVADIRYWVYFITKNPIIFSVTESMTFMQKSWNLRKMDVRAFDTAVKMMELRHYIKRVDATMRELEYVKHYLTANCGNPYDKRCSSIYYAENVKRHFQDTFIRDSNGNKIFTSRKTTLKKIYDTAATVLYDVVPCAFRDMATGFRWNPHKFALYPDKDLIELLEDDPYIIVPRDLCPQ